MSRCPFAGWDPLPSSSAGPFTGGPYKGVAHKTQGASYAGARATYLARSLGPHFTIAEDGALFQHLDTGEASSAVANDSGGVQTNRDGAIQVEVVGFSGQTATSAQLATFVRLQGWLHDTHDVPLVWPMGRPPQDSAAGYGVNNGHRNGAVWDSTGGWYAHAQVPENTHWDPAWTDDEWDYITAQGDEDVMTDEEHWTLYNMAAAVGRLELAVYAMSTTDQVDESGIADSIAERITPALVTAVGEGADAAAITAAVKAALREGTG